MHKIWHWFRGVENDPKFWNGAVAANGDGKRKWRSSMIARTPRGKAEADRNGNKNGNNDIMHAFDAIQAASSSTPTVLPSHQKRERKGKATKKEKTETNEQQKMGERERKRRDSREEMMEMKMANGGRGEVKRRATKNTENGKSRVMDRAATNNWNSSQQNMVAYQNKKKRMGWIKADLHVIKYTFIL